MAAGRIKGITIEIAGDSTKLTSALSQVDRALATTQTNLRDINKALKLDPGNVELIKDKQNELNKAVEEAKKKVEQEEEALRQLKNTEGFDANSEAARNLKVQLDLDKAALGELEKQARQSASVLGQSLQAAGDKLQAVGDKIKGVSAKISAIGTEMTTKLTLPIVGFGTVAVAKFAEVDKTMTLTNATMKNTADEAQNLNRAMEEAASKSTFGMNDAAQASLNFARAGLNAAQAADAIAPAMNLAAGEAGDLNTVSSGLVATINGFGDGFDEAEHYADVFAAACNNSALDVNTLSESMSVAAPIFSTAGKNVEDAALYLGVMANAGIDANVAANSLKTGMARLAEPTKQAKEAMEQYGIAMSDIWNEDGSMKEMTVIQENLNKSFADLSEQEQMAAAGAIFGKNQMAPWLALIRTAPDDVQKLNKSLAESKGTTEEMAKAMMEGFGGSIEGLKSKLDVLMTSLGSLIATYLTPLIDKVQKAVDWFMSLDKGTQDLIVRIAAIVAAIGPVISILGGLGSAIGGIVTVVGAITSAVGAIMPIISGIMAALPTLGTVIAALTSPIGLVVAAIAALVAGGIALYQNWDVVKEKCGQFAAGVSAKFEELKTAATAKFNAIKESASTAFENIKSNVSEKMAAVKSVMSNVMESVKGLVDTKLHNIKNAFESNGGGIKGIVSAYMTAIKEFWKSGFDALNLITNGRLGDIADQMRRVLGGIASSAWNWGRDIISGLVDGIRSRISSVASAVSDIADTIRSYIHFSVPDKGPLADFNSYMPDMTNQLAKGMIKGIPTIESAMDRMAGAMMPQTTVPEVGTSNVSTSNNINVNVYGAQGQDVNELATIIEQKITDNVVRRGVAFA